MTLEQFKSSVIPNQDKMYRYAVSILFDTDSARDIVQDVFMKLWKQRESLGEVDNIEAWCIRLTRNTCYDKMRATKKNSLGLEFAALKMTGDSSPGEKAEHNDLILNIYDLIKDLPKQQQEIFRLREILGYSNKEIESLMLLNENQVKVNLFRARNKVKSSLEKIINYGLTK